MGSLFRFLLLIGLKALALVFYRFDVRWLDSRRGPWSDLRIIALLNHTSLYEWLYVGATPNAIVWRIAGRAFVPIADKTAARPIVGPFLTSLTPYHEPISREADHTWKAVLDRLRDDVMIIILPEGRMKRANGLDKNGQPMTVRGGIADILRSTPDGRMLLVYLGGLHHVQAPGERRTPRLWKTLRVALHAIDIEQYKREVGVPEKAAGFKAAVKADLERRRDLHCPAPPPRQASALPAAEA